MFDALSTSLTAAYRSIVGSKSLTEANIDEGIRAVRRALLEADVHYQVAKDFVDDVKRRAVGQNVLTAVDPGQQFVKVFHDALTDLLGGDKRGLPEADRSPLVLMMAGLQGSGKTTTCAKLARWLVENRRRRPLLVAADLQRPAAVEQLRTLGAQLGIAVYAEGTDASPPEVCERGIQHARQHQHDVVILDTAGRLHIDEPLMSELDDVHRRCRPHGVLLVCDAMLGQDAVNSAKAFDARLPIWGVILTKTDGDARGGAALSIKQVTGKPILFVGTGEKSDELEEFDPPRMAGRILDMGDVVSLVERAQSVIDEQDAEKEARKLLKGDFNFESFINQLNWIRRIGPLKKVLGMLPGMGQMLKNVDLDDRRFARVEAIIQSMTVRERRNPDAIDVQRRRRIAKGSGNDLQAVHALMKQFKDMQRMMKALGQRGMQDLMQGGMPDPSQLGGMPGMPGMPGGGKVRGGGRKSGGNQAFRDFMRKR